MQTLAGEIHHQITTTDGVTHQTTIITTAMARLGKEMEAGNRALCNLYVSDLVSKGIGVREAAIGLVRLDPTVHVRTLNSIRKLHI